MTTTTSHFPSGYLSHMPCPLPSSFPHCLSNKAQGFYESSAVAMWTPCFVWYIHYIQFLYEMSHIQMKASQCAHSKHKSLQLHEKDSSNKLKWKLPMCPFQIWQQFTTAWNGFKEPVLSWTVWEYDDDMCWGKLNKTGTGVERSQRKSLAQLAWQMHLPALSAGNALNCCVCIHVRQ